MSRKAPGDVVNRIVYRLEGIIRSVAVVILRYPSLVAEQAVIVIISEEVVKPLLDRSTVLIQRHRHESIVGLSPDVVRRRRTHGRGPGRKLHEKESALFSMRRRDSLLGSG